MAKITRYAMGIDTIKKITAQRSYLIQETNGKRHKVIYNTNKFYSTAQYSRNLYNIIGTKTGTTQAAGYVFSATYILDEISSRKTVLSGAGHVGGGHVEGDGFIRHEGGHVGDLQVLPALGHHQHQLQIAAALRGQVGGLGEGLGVGIVQRDIGTALHTLTVAGSGKVGGSSSQCVEVGVHVLLRGHGISCVDLVQSAKHLVYTLVGFLQVFICILLVL